MDTSTIITIVSTIITAFSIGIAAFQINSEKKYFILMGHQRRKVLTGKWAGTYIQDNKMDGISLNGTVQMILVAGRKVIDGKVFIESGLGQQLEFGVNGGFKFERFLALSYNNKLQHVAQFGFFLLELSPDATVLEGRILGFGPQSRKIVVAKIRLKCEDLLMLELRQ